MAASRFRVRKGYLGEQFTAVGVKRLSSVDAELDISNQHEVGTTRPMRERLLGDTAKKFKVAYFWIGEDGDVLSDIGVATHYDARAQKEYRSPEWRLYYPSNAVTNRMREGDLLLLAIDKRDLLHFIVAQGSSDAERQLCWLFNIYPNEVGYVWRDFGEDEIELGLAARLILDGLGIQVVDSDTGGLEEVIEKFGMEFPTTAELHRVSNLFAGH